MEIANIEHKEMTDEEAYMECKRLYELRPDIIMSPSVWKKKRLMILESNGKEWTK